MVLIFTVNLNAEALCKSTVTFRIIICCVMLSLSLCMTCVNACKKWQSMRELHNIMSSIVSCCIELHSVWYRNFSQKRRLLERSWESCYVIIFYAFSHHCCNGGWIISNDSFIYSTLIQLCIIRQWFSLMIL